MSVSKTYAVAVTTEALGQSQHRCTCSCSCGWSLTTPAASPQMATRIADRAHGNHLLDAHPDQARSRSHLSLPASSDHAPALSEATRAGFGWTCTVLCDCDWQLTVTGRSALEADTAARQRHHRHVNGEIIDLPGRDRLVLLGIVAVVATVLLVLTTIAAQLR